MLKIVFLVHDCELKIEKRENAKRDQLSVYM